MRVNVEYLDQQIDETGTLIKQKEALLKDSEVWDTWRRKYRSKANLGSKAQLAEVVFNILKYPRSSTGSKQDEAAFSSVDHPFVRDYFEVEKLKKVKGTYLLGIRREVQDGYMRPFFNLHTVKTYRSSSDKINFQNIPIRNPVMGKLIRSAFVPRDGHVIVEIDYSGLEFTMAGAITRDPAIRRYIENDGDPHRDMAALVFICEPGEVSKQMRYCGKNQFVFPELYGSYFISCAPVLWQSMESMNLEINGKSVRAHLADHGIERLGKLDPRNTEPGTFVHHMKECEHQYTKVKFKKCFDVQRQAYENYRKTGVVEFATGFIARGLMSRNDVYNWRIQGPAFHCLLWSLIQINKRLVKERWRSKIIGQIHDSIVGDVHEDELPEYLAYAKDIMTNQIRQHWDWLCVPLSVEAEACPLGGTWNDKKVIQI